MQTECLFGFHAAAQVRRLLHDECIIETSSFGEKKNVGATYLCSDSTTFCTRLHSGTPVKTQSDIHNVATICYSYGVTNLAMVLLQAEYTTPFLAVLATPFLPLWIIRAQRHRHTIDVMQLRLQMIEIHLVLRLLENRIFH